MKKSKKVRMEDIGLYIRTITMDYNPKNQKELAELISEQFDVICTEEDIAHYDELNEQLMDQWEEFESLENNY